MIYLDTHVVIWFYARLYKRFPPVARTLMNENEWRISPIVRLEMQLLHEIGRVSVDPDTIISALATQVGLTLCAEPFNVVIGSSLAHNWTRDPFDRVLVAHAAVNNNILVTADDQIRHHYSRAIWDKPQ